MKLTLIGAGCGSETLTRAAAETIENSQLVLATERLIDMHRSLIPAGSGEVCVPLAENVRARLTASDAERVCVLLSGDSGFYSAARQLLPALKDIAEIDILPGISSVQMLSAKIGQPWQDWRVCSAHGAALDLLCELKHGKPLFLLTSGKDDPARLCEELTAAGLGRLRVTVGEALGSAEERIVTDTAEALRSKAFHPLNVMLIEAAPMVKQRTGGLPDEAFQRAEGVPMTKQVVRAAALSKLGVGADDVCWDIGAGTGSVSIEMAHLGRAVWAIERSDAALTALRQNRERLCAWNLRIVSGEAPGALSDLPMPDKVFIGGSGGHLREILHVVHGANPGAAVCVSAIALETLESAVSELEALGYETEITQLAVSHSRRAGTLHMMLAQNPVYLVTGYKK